MRILETSAFLIRRIRYQCKGSFARTRKGYVITILISVRSSKAKQILRTLGYNHIYAHPRLCCKSIRRASSENQTHCKVVIDLQRLPISGMSSSGNGQLLCEFAMREKFELTSVGNPRTAVCENDDTTSGVAVTIQCLLTTARSRPHPLYGMNRRYYR